MVSWNKWEGELPPAKTGHHHTSPPFEPTRSAGFSFTLSATRPQIQQTTPDITDAKPYGGDLMARKNNRKHYRNRWLPDDLFKLTKQKANPSITPQGGREKDIPMETCSKNTTQVSVVPVVPTSHAPVSQPTLTPRPAKPQGVDDPRITRGSVWFADLAARSTSNLITSVQSGTRPVLVISNDLNNRFGTVITIIPFTGAPKRLDMPTHVAVTPSDVRNGYQPSEIYESTLLAEQVTALDKARLVSYVGSVVNPKLMSQIEAALLTQIGITSQAHNQPSEEVRNHVQS